MDVINNSHIHHSDINECNSTNGGCEQLCVNDIASFHCECNTGYMLDDNGYSCSGKYHRCVCHSVCVCVSAVYKWVLL